MRNLIWVFAVLVITSCAPEKELEIEQLQIITKDATAMINWYTTNLGFKTVEDGLVVRDFRIQLKNSADASRSDDLKQAHQLQHLPGFFKIGFITNQFGELLAQLRQNNVHFVRNIFYNKVIGRRSAIIKDPDGNQIQLFEDFGRHKLKPFYIAVAVESIGEQEKWYQMKLPVKKTHNLDLPDKKVFVRLLEGESFLIELINTAGITVKPELESRERIGFHSIKVRGAGAPFKEDREGNLIIHQ